MDVAIFGAGMAGLSAGAQHVSAGNNVTMVEKRLSPGGRMATRRIQTTTVEGRFDRGAPYFTTRDAAFAASIERWAEAGHVARWPAAGYGAWVKAPAKNAPVMAMTAGLDVQLNARVEAIEPCKLSWILRRERASGVDLSALVLAVPGEKAAELLAPVAGERAELATATASAPCWAVMAILQSAGSCEADVLVANSGAIGSAADISAKPGRSGPEAWGTRGTSGWAVDHFEQNAGSIICVIRATFAKLVGALPDALAATAHRWRYARTSSAGGHLRWDAARNPSLCGDWQSWPRVETVGLSGNCRTGAMCG